MNYIVCHLIPTMMQYYIYNININPLQFFEGNDLGVLRFKHHRHMTGLELHEPIIPYTVNAGLYSVFCLDTIAIDHALVITVIEHWRQETHTFHLLVGEATFTLQDIAVLLSLRIDGRRVISPIMQDV